MSQHDQQSLWDHEDDRDFRQRLRQLQLNLSAASAAESEARAVWAERVRDRKEARLKLEQYLEEVRPAHAAIRSQGGSD